MKYCKDCKFCKVERDEELAKCTNPKLEKFSVSPVTGLPIKAWMAASGIQEFLPYCRTARLVLTVKQCGPDAELFEPK